MFHPPRSGELGRNPSTAGGAALKWRKVIPQLLGATGSPRGEPQCCFIVFKHHFNLFLVFSLLKPTLVFVIV